MKYLRIFYVGICLVFLVYLRIPSPDFPVAPSDSPQSKEPGDVLDLETRRAYFTNLSREEVRTHYQLAFKHHGVFGFIPSINLQNYPREEADWHVYSPLLSSYLEELIYPFRESLFINFYEPGESDDKLAFEGKEYPIKITVKYYKSDWKMRVLIAAGAMVTIYVLAKFYGQEIRRLFSMKG